VQQHLPLAHFGLPQSFELPCRQVLLDHSSDDVAPVLRRHRIQLDRLMATPLLTDCRFPNEVGQY
jgi:hypothetical protein